MGCDGRDDVCVVFTAKAHYNKYMEPWKKVTMSKDENKSEEEFLSCQEHMALAERIESINMILIYDVARYDKWCGPEWMPKNNSDWQCNR